MIGTVLRAILLLCLSVSACRGVDPAAAFARALPNSTRGYIARDGECVAECAVTTTRDALPRAAAVTVAAVQPDAARTDFERVWRNGEVLYRARSHYPPPGPATRTVLVDAAGRVVERGFEISAAAAEAAADLSPAVAALRRALPAVDVRLEVVHGEAGREWLRARTDTAPGTRIVDCDRDGQTCRTWDVEWRDGGATALPPGEPQR